MCVCAFLVQLEDLPVSVRVKVTVLGIFLSFFHNKFRDPSRDSNAHFRPPPPPPPVLSLTLNLLLSTLGRDLGRQATVLFV